MDRLERLMSLYPNIEFEFDNHMPMDDGGLNIGNRIIINSNISEFEQYQWLCEELGHHETSVGDITNYSPVGNAKQEHRARFWGYTHLLTHSDMDRLKREYAQEESDYPAAEDLGIELPYLHEAGLAYGLDFKHVKD